MTDLHSIGNDRNPSNIIILAAGSHGDVHPLLGLALRLKERGRRVTFMVNPYFEGLVRRVGVDFVGLGTAEQFTRIMHDPDLWHPTRGLRAVFEKGVNPFYRQVYDKLLAHHVPGRTVVVAHPIALSARVFQETHNVPTVTIQLAPMSFRSIHDAPYPTSRAVQPWMPVWWRKWFWSALDRWLIDPVIAPELNKFRSEFDLQPVKAILEDYWFSPDRVIALFPEWFCMPQSDWPKQTRCVGFPLWDEKGVEPVPDAVEQFLSQGDAPIAFTPGSAMVQGKAFFATAVQACQHLGRRGILLTRHPEQLPKDLPDSVRHFAYVPFSQLLPRCAALVHHGGIGTTSQALAAGVPQLVMPMSHDQPDNAWRVERLRCGSWLLPQRFTAKRVAAKLESILTPETRASCKEVARQFDDVDALGKAADLVEDLVLSRCETSALEAAPV